MTPAIWCVLIAGLLPYAATLTAKAGARFDNSHPRPWLDALQGWRARAHAAQLNGFEAFPLFAAAVILASMRHAPQLGIDRLAIAFIALRVGFFVAYLANIAWLRSVLWFGGIGCAVAIFVAGT